MPDDEIVYESRDITCPRCPQVLGTAEFPEGTDESIWDRAVNYGYICRRKPVAFGSERLDTNDVSQVTPWSDCLHHNFLNFQIVSTNGPDNEVPIYVDFVVAVEHSSDGVNVDGEVTTKQGVGVVDDIDIDAYNFVRFKVKTAEGVGSWVSIQGLTEWRQV